MALDEGSGGTAIHVALDDMLETLGPFAPGLVVLITDGASSATLFAESAAALAAADLTLACIGVDGANFALLEANCATAADGTPLVFTADSVLDVSTLLEQTIVAIGAPRIPQLALRAGTTAAASRRDAASSSRRLSRSVRSHTSHYYRSAGNVWQTTSQQWYAI